MGAPPFQVLHCARYRQAGRNGQQQMNVLPVDRPGVNDHFVRPCCLANQFTASLSHIAPKDGEPIFRNPYNVVLTVPDRMAAAFVALHDPVYTGPAGVPCRLKAWGFLIPYRGLKDMLSGVPVCNGWR